MKTPKQTLLVLAVWLACSGTAGAIDFLETYRLAKQNDPTFASARASLEAGLEKLPQGRALLLPVINGAANTNWNEARNVTGQRDINWNSNGWNVTLTQPIFRWQNLVQYQQSQFQVLQAEAQFGQATMDLIVRVAQAYTDVLAAQDNLEFTKANKIAINEQLAQAKRNFEVGTATITDTNEAQARFDIATAQEIAAVNALEVAVRALQQIIGIVPDKLVPLRAITIDAPQPNVMDDWVGGARANNLVVKGNEAVLEIASREIERQRAGHYPTLDAVASYQDNTTLNPAAAFAGTNVPRAEVTQSIIGLQLNVPIYAGGSVNSRTREAVALREKARQDLEASRRAAEFNARQSFLNVTNGLAQVKALEQALTSSEVALQSNRVGYEVGVRINIDVLNAQQQVLQTQRDLARARYDTLLNGLRLKSAAGSLTEGDVEAVNRLLGYDQPRSTKPVSMLPVPFARTPDASLQPLAAPPRKDETAAPAPKVAAVRGKSESRKAPANGAKPAPARAQGAEAAPEAKRIEPAPAENIVASASAKESVAAPLTQQAQDKAAPSAVPADVKQVPPVAQGDAQAARSYVEPVIPVAGLPTLDAGDAPVKAD